MPNWRQTVGDPVAIASDVRMHALYPHLQLAVSDSALANVPGGDVVIGGHEWNTPGTSLQARRSGTSWSDVTPGNGGTNAMVASLHAARDGTLRVGGQFATAGGEPSAMFAELVATCPATATPFGNGCAGSGGVNVLSATSLPWLGTGCRTTATDMPPSGIALTLSGLATANVALSAVLPQGLPGCSLLTSVELIELSAPLSGEVTSVLVIPNATALIGQVVHRQVVAIELGPLGAFVALTSTNRVTLTIGVF
jgi:hypothetical protein